jgi:fatty-acyl-CoA synthase
MSDPSTPWVDGLTLGQVLRETARRFADHDALVFPKQRLRASYAEFDALVDDAARGLMALGIARGDHVAVWATNRPEWVILQFATARIGAVLVTVNPAYRSHELGYVLGQSDVRALVLIDRFKSSDYFPMLAEVCPELAGSEPGKLKSARFPRLDWVVALVDDPPAGMLAWQEMLARAGSIPVEDLRAREAQLQPEQAINIQYTSGTTGFPKGAMLTHRNLLLNAYYIGDCQRIGDQDRICIPVPFYHCFGCVLGTLCAVVYGAAMLIPAEYFDPEATLDCIESERATAIYGVPTMFIAMLEHESFPARDCSSLRTGIMAGSPCPIEVMKRVVDKMGAREVTIAYGQTEASPVITQTRVDDPLDLRVRTVGRPIPGIEVKVIDPATGETLGDNQQGELCTRGHVVMLGYYKMPDETAAAIDPQGWLHTGDLAVREPNGYYRITGRIKDMVIRGGENVYPREIEEFLYSHPQVEDVQVVGVPDAKYGEELAAYVKLRAGGSATEDEVRAFCKGKLAHYKVPRYVRFVESYPQTVTGKIQKYKIREQAIRDLGLEEVARTETA